MYLVSQSWMLAQNRKRYRERLGKGGGDWGLDWGMCSSVAGIPQGAWQLPALCPEGCSQPWIAAG